jgi:predicted NBD/HSP70 family sugar kinase/mannose-6-phosphate isomerase class I
MIHMFKHTDKTISLQEPVTGYALGVDVGGSHISSAMVDLSDGEILKHTLCREVVDTNADRYFILQQWIRTLKSSLSGCAPGELQGIGISMPGPFDYDKGISLINGVHKYDSLFGINLRQVFIDELSLGENVPVIFENDASCFGLGESLEGEAKGFKKTIVITLGTGLGATFLRNRKIIKNGNGVPPKGFLYNIPFEGGIAEDFISTRGILKSYNQLTGIQLISAKEIAEKAILQKDIYALKSFEIFGRHLAKCLQPWLIAFKTDCLVIGGSISKSSSLFFPSFQNELGKKNIKITIKISKRMELSSITGAAALVKEKEKMYGKNDVLSKTWRKSSQPLLPENASGLGTRPGEYDMYPFHKLENEHIYSGYESLAKWISDQKLMIIDGFVGVNWDAIRQECSEYFKQKNIKALWFQMSAFEKPGKEIEEMVKPFLGEPGTVWGTKTTLGLEDFYDTEKLASLHPDSNYDVNIIIGPGASLSHWKASVIYVDLPKNELQYRMRAGSITNLGASTIDHPSQMYKRFYFVDWVVLSEYRKRIKEHISIIADGQRQDELNWALHSSIKKGFEYISQNIIRARPWFEAGAWGGQWLKKHVPSLNQNEVNYAWSFELIAPENGVVFESDGNLLEVSFDWLMEFDEKAILGKDAARFGTNFPIRFDFLDTFDGGNLSIQCHPSLSYIQKEFGEKTTQDETYYILDCKDEAKVYLGFQENIDPAEFKSALEKSVVENKTIDVEKYIQALPSKKHDFYLIPNRTVHSSGTNNLVLEISATPYIFTFKMYDWLSLDLNSEPRPISIEYAFNNLDFSRKGDKVKEELVSKPVVIEDKKDYQIVHLPTHKDHFYDVHRIDLVKEAVISTEEQCHILMVVEGQSVLVKSKNGDQKTFHYAETFVIPAAAGEYTLINQGSEPIKVIKAFVK